MIPVTALRAGITFQLDGKPLLVLKYNHTKMGRGTATIKVRARNLETGAILEKTFISNDSVEEVQTTKKKLQFLYSDPENAVFMDPVTFEQIEIGTKILGPSLKFLKEGGQVDVLFWDPSTSSGQVALSVDLPPKVNLKVKEADPGVKGNSASNVYKDAVLENDLKIRVPLFIKTGNMVRVDTRTGEYLERAN